MPPRFFLLIAAQFTSALADNALLIVTIALLKEQGMPGWWAPMLKFGFTISYVVFAPFVGPLADAMRKARLMAVMNGVKVVGVLILMAAMHPIAAYAIVGFGAAAYAPAKYGLITELVEPKRLVTANGWLEVSIVCAVLLGTMAGGVLVSPGLLHSSPAIACHQWLAALGLFRPTGVSLSLMVVLAIYGLAALLNLGVPDSGARYDRGLTHPVMLVRQFWRSNLELWRDRDGGLSLAVTTIFWGAGATLQFAVFRWAADELGLPLDKAAYLQGAVAIGVIFGAAGAGMFVPLRHAKKMLFAGVVLGLLMPIVASTRSLPLAVSLLILTGAVGGLLVVPLNALLQDRGCTLFSAGRSVAIQGFNENAGVLVMLAGYATLVSLDMPIVPLLCGLGVATASAIALLMFRERARERAQERDNRSADPAERTAPQVSLL